MSVKSPQQQLDDVLKLYLEKKMQVPTNTNLELEVKFGTKGKFRITHSIYDNVIKRLLSLGFTSSNQEYFLRINNEYIDSKTGVTKMSNVRGEIMGLGRISEYCRTDNILDKNDLSVITFDQKSYYRDESSVVYPVDFKDFNFRVSLQNERRLNFNSALARSIRESWKDSKKTFRLINRTTLRSDRYPVKIDLSIVKSSKQDGRNMIPEYKFKDSGVLESIEYYEIEIEVDNEKIRNYSGAPYSTVESLGNSLRKVIKLVLSGMQSTNFPISYPEQDKIKTEYMKILWGKTEERPKITTRNFVGPSSFTLQIVNIAPKNDDAIIPNIRENYTVTDKADGDRKLLIISQNGKIYLMDTNMNVQFTGAVTKNKDVFNTIIDGEHILRDKTGKFINFYAAFDIYYVNNSDKRGFPFAPVGELSKDYEPSNFRLFVLHTVVKELNPTSVVKGDEISPMLIDVKTFQIASDSQTIFQACDKIIRKVKDGIFEYETDGLIFTPGLLPVGGDQPGKPGKPLKSTWNYSFKWKPVEFNTIDFLVTIKKDTDGRDLIKNIFENGTDTGSVVQLTQYKTAILRVGFDTKTHGYINPCLDIINDNYPENNNSDNLEGYQPVQFYPTNPSDMKAGICNILLHLTGSGDKVMLAESQEIIEDNMIVEFRYNENGKKGFKWIPLRVRYDKTAELRTGGNQFGNAYHVANSNWHSIHNPISEEMITTGQNIPDELGDDDIYYNKVSGATNTRGLRDFHNLFVKKLLIMSVSQKGDTLIDLAVGKAGDIPKWIKSKLKFVLGIDVAGDNIENRLDGACARYLNYHKKFKTIPRALFVKGDSSVNIRNTDGIFTEKGKQIVKAVFGQGAKDAKDLGQGVYKSYGVAEEGFNVCSIQFAIHYMFKSQETLYQFLRNVSETTSVGGYFIGTSYDGASIFKKLENKKIGESVTIMENDSKIWELTKRYDQTEFESNASSIGYAIDVYQESINKTAREYLVNYDYLTRLLENYGFVLLKQDEASKMGIPGSTGLFNELFGLMENNISKNKRLQTEYGKAMNMTAGERQISFLNRYFVFKKIRNVDADKVSRALLGQSIDEEPVIEEPIIEDIKKIDEEAVQSSKPKKIKKKLNLKSKKKITEQKGGEGTVRSLGKGLVNGTFANAWADRPIMDPSIIKSDSNSVNIIEKTSISPNKTSTQVIRSRISGRDESRGPAR